MHERPIGDLLDALRELGADIECLDNEGFRRCEYIHPLMELLAIRLARQTTTGKSLVIPNPLL